MRFTGVLCAMAVLAATTAAHGQTRVVRYGDDRLAGITEVDVVVTTSDRGCAPSRTALQKSAVEHLREAGVRTTLSERASSWHYTVFVHVHSAAVAGSCASAVATELAAHVEGIPEADKFAPAGAWGSILIGPMALTREMELVTTPAREHDVAVREAARTQVATLAERIRRANP